MNNALIKNRQELRLTLMSINFCMDSTHSNNMTLD